jgi:hypothetical protein
MNGHHRFSSRCVPAVALVAAAIVLVSSPLWASLVVLMDLEELVGESDSIVQGLVEDVQSRWEDRQIFTYVTIGIDEPLKGDRTRTLVIRQLGGQVGSLQAVVAGMPQFEPGENVIAFLKNAGNGTFHVVGMNQGRYVIAEDYAVSNLSGVDLMNPKNGVVSGAATAKRVEVEQFKARIRDLVR